MTQPSIETMLLEIGFTPAWLECGIINEESLRVIYQRHISSELRHAEGLRDAAYAEFLKRCKVLTDESVDQLMDLHDRGSDGVDLRPNRAIQLIESCLMTDAQHFALSRRHPWVLEPPVARIFERVGLIRRLRSESTSEVFPEIQQSMDAIVHMALLMHPGVERGHLLWISEQGVTRAVRNRAREMLKRKKWRSHD